MRIGICGLGKLGFPLAIAIERKGHAVFGYEIREALMTKQLRTMEACEDGQGNYSEVVAQSDLQFVHSIGELVAEADIIFVAVQTPSDAKYEGTNKVWGMGRKDYDYSFLENAVRSISGAVEAGGVDKVIAIVCTVLPGTCRSRIKPLLGSHSKLVYNPFTVAMGTVVRDFYSQEFYIVGLDDPWACDQVVQFYKSISVSKVYTTGLENAELIKVLYNSFITTKICFANTVMEFCHKIPGADCDEVMGALKMATRRLISPEYLSGGMVDAGPCHPKDLRSLWFLAERTGLSFDLFDALVLSTERQTEWLASLIREERGDRPVVLLGKTFKENIDIDAGSSAYLLRECLEEMDVAVKEHYDPYIDVAGPGDLFLDPACFVVCTKHKLFYDVPFPKGSVVVDIFRWLPEQDGVRYVRIGVGPSV